MKSEQHPVLVIGPQVSLFDLKLKAVWRFRDLLRMFVRRDFVATYKQTILGPIWFFIQPVLTTITFTIIFGNIAGISTDGTPKLLFYMTGITIWNYFSECLNNTSTVFRSNASLFGKVYFPRLIMPLTLVISGLFKFLIQFLMMIGFLFFFLWRGDAGVEPNLYLLLVPYLLVLMAALGMGVGMIISAMTTKYRDLAMLVGFGVQLLMYATPVIYPVSTLPEKYKAYVLANPLTGIVETFRFAFLGSGSFSWSLLAYSSVCAIVLLLLGTVVFNKVEKTFIDTV
jgi:lipopolysaccharide transport system permease protein